MTTGDGETLNVPLPGHKLSDTRSRANLLRGLSVAALVLALLLTAGVGAFLATLATRDGAPGTDGTTGTADSWNTDAGAAMGTRYLRWCLTRYGDQDREQSRFDQLSSMNTATDEACGAGNGNTASADQARTVSSVIFTGIVQEVPGIPNARYLGFAANTSEGELGYMVPVYLDDPAAGTGPRVVGKSGVVNVGGYGVPAGPEEAPATDPDLARELQTNYLPEFFTAWTGSTDSLEQFLSTDATANARDGLGGRLVDPKLDKVAVLPPADAGEPGNYNYSDGMRVTVQTTITATHHRGAPEASAYRITLVRTGEKWFVADVDGAFASIPAGGATGPNPQATPS